MPALHQVFAALSDPTRFAIIERLMHEGELPVAKIGDGFAISAPAVSRHLGVLQRTGLVNRRVNAQQRMYSVRPEAIEAISVWTIRHKDFWEGSLRRLETALTEKGMNK